MKKSPKKAKAILKKPVLKKVRVIKSKSKKAAVPLLAPVSRKTIVSGSSRLSIKRRIRSDKVNKNRGNAISSIPSYNPGT
tara:strand:- start:43 stop:282 length:240 start_codon:yes stop_codon:yes gene_type:complete